MLLTAREKRALRDFVLIWSLYEAQVLNCQATAPRMLRAIDLWNENDLLTGDSIGESWNYFVHRLTTQHVINHRFEALRFQNAAQRTLAEDALTALEPRPDTLGRHQSLALVIHRLRNNLMHGEKWSYGLADQEANFVHAAHVLMVWTSLSRNAPVAQLLI